MAVPNLFAVLDADGFRNVLPTTSTNQVALVREAKSDVITGIARIVTDGGDAMQGKR